MVGLLAVVPFALLVSGQPLDAASMHPVACSTSANTNCIDVGYYGSYYYVTGLDPYGYNWLALRNQPSFNASWSPYVHMTPGTRVSVIGRSGEWLRVRTLYGDVGWANGRYLACCR